MELSDDETERALNNFDSDDDRGNRSDEAEEEPAGGKKDGEEEDEETKRRIDPATSKKRIVRNPLPKLNAERIQGPKGMQTIEKSFEDFKFQGKGHEKDDLNAVMKKLEYWAHRLFPKYCFDDFIKKMEILGAKKNIQVFLKKCRLGMVDADYGQVTANGGEEDNMERGEVIEAEPIDEFDKLISEQIEKQRAIEKTHGVPRSSQGNVLGSASAVKPSELSDEIKARIEANKKLALQRKMARAKILEEEKEKAELEEARKNSQMAIIQAHIQQEVSINNDTNVKELPTNAETVLGTSANGSITNIKILSNTETNLLSPLNNKETDIETLPTTAVTYLERSEKNEANQDRDIEKRKRLKFENSPKDLNANPLEFMIMEKNKSQEANSNNPKESNETESMVLDSEGNIISGVENASKEVQEQSNASLPELEEAMDVSEEKETQETPDTPECNKSLQEKESGGDMGNDSEKLLTEEELLMAIDGAMEEIIENRSIVL